MANNENILFKEYFEENESRFALLHELRDFISDNKFMNFVDFGNFLESYGFIHESTDSMPLRYCLYNEPFSYSVSLFGDKLYFRLAYITNNGNKYGAEFRNRYYRIFMEYRCLDEIFFHLTNSIAREILKNGNNEQDMLNLIRRRLIIKEQC